MRGDVIYEFIVIKYLRKGNVCGKESKETDEKMFVLMMMMMMRKWPRG